MLLSLFTPTNNPAYLPELYASVRLQPGVSFEWVLLLNGGVARADLPADLLSDPRVRALPAVTASANVGALKREACDRCAGDVLVEVDHDDVLVPGALAKVAAGAALGGGFLYSDVAVFEPDGKTWSYDARYGWEGYPVNVYGRRFVATRNFAVTPRSLCEVFYAPDHVRAWTRAAYYGAGGHDASMSVGDDHDLVCRTYLAGFPFVHVGGCCYLYRFHPDNTVKRRNHEIQLQQAKNRRRYLPPLIAEWCRRGGLRRGNVGHMLRAGEWRPGVPLPWADGSVGHLSANFAHDDLDGGQVAVAMREAWRVLVPGGFVTATVGAAAGEADPFGDFVRRGPAGSARLFDQANREELVARGARAVRSELAAIKGQRWPGPAHI